MWFKKYPGSSEWGRPYMKAILMRSDWTKQLSVAATRRHGCARVVGVCLFPWALILHYYRYTICLPEPRGGRGAAAHRNCWAGQIKSVDGFVPFRLSYFDCSNLHLFSIFTREDTDPPPPYKARAFGSCDNAPPPPRGKKTCYAPAYLPQRKPATSQFLDD